MTRLEGQGKFLPKHKFAEQGDFCASLRETFDSICSITLSLSCFPLWWPVVWKRRGRITSDTAHGPNCVSNDITGSCKASIHQVKQNIFSARSQGDVASCPGESVTQWLLVFHKPCFLCFAVKNNSFCTRGIRTRWNSHFSKQKSSFFARQSRENWCNSSRRFDYWETDVWHPLCSPGRDKLIWSVLISLYRLFVFSQSVRYRIKLSK